MSFQKCWLTIYPRRCFFFFSLFKSGLIFTCCSFCHSVFMWARHACHSGSSSNFDFIWRARFECIAWYVFSLSLSVALKTFNQYQKYICTTLNTMFLSLNKHNYHFYVDVCNEWRDDEQKKTIHIWICDKQNEISNCATIRLMYGRW